MTSANIVNVGAQLPRYKCHKEVWALKIQAIEREPFGDAGMRYTLVPADARYAPFEVDFEFIEKHSPRVGGYYVIYDADGYKSFSPAKAFEEGYTLVLPTQPARSTREQQIDDLVDAGRLLERYEGRDPDDNEMVRIARATIAAAKRPDSPALRTAPELVGKHAMVLYFNTKEDADGFAATCREAYGDKFTARSVE